MTHISEYKTKKLFKEMVKEDPYSVYLEDPAIIGGVSGYLPKILEKKESITVTNHPKRSWFASVETKTDGQYLVK